jgi:two-component system chemotaxis response regulator CheY
VDGDMKSFLVVDDSSVVRKIARQFLEALSFRVSEADNGETALVACGRAMPDAILLDWNMPVTDGPSFLARLRRLEGGDAPKVIFCTTENDVEHIAMALSVGADEYIMKPFDHDILRAKLEEVGLIAPSEPSACPVAP